MSLAAAVSASSPLLSGTSSSSSSVDSKKADPQAVVTQAIRENSLFTTSSDLRLLSRERPVAWVQTSYDSSSFTSFRVSIFEKDSFNVDRYKIIDYLFLITPEGLIKKTRKTEPSFIDQFTNKPCLSVQEFSQICACVYTPCSAEQTKAIGLLTESKFYAFWDEEATSGRPLIIKRAPNDNRLGCKFILSLVRKGTKEEAHYCVDSNGYIQTSQEPLEGFTRISRVEEFLSECATVTASNCCSSLPPCCRIC